MAEGRFQFRLSHLFIGTTFVAIVVAASTLLPSLYYTYGAIGAAFLGLLFCLFAIVCGGCLLFRRLRVPTFVVCVVVCTLLIYHQSVLNRRLDQLHAEVAHIVSYVNTYKSAHGEFPRQLSGYEYQRPELQTYIKYSPPGGPYGSTSYVIRYHPTENDGIGHWYFGDQGYWFEDD
jgi:hypothetical protein